MEHNLPNRKRLRLFDFYYGTPGTYFITICTIDRQPLLSRTQYDKATDSASVILSQHGKIVDKQLQQMRTFYPTISILHHVIMPNHVHLILNVTDEETANTAPRQHSAVSRFISTFKRFCNKESGAKLWQRGFHDHIIRDLADYERHLRYIEENPIRWQTDELVCETPQSYQ